MPDSSPDFRHIYFKGEIREFDYTRRSNSNSAALFTRDRGKHAQMLKAQVSKIESTFDQLVKEREEADLPAQFGLTLNVESAPGHELAFTSLENHPHSENEPDITLLNVRREQTAQGEITKAAIFVPFGQLKVLEKKIDEYETKDTKNGKPLNQPLIANINSISIAAIDALWTDLDNKPAFEDSCWFEFWIRRDGQDWEAQLNAEFTQLGITLPTQKIILPEHIIVVAETSLNQISSSLDLLNTLSEIRIARPCSLGLTELKDSEQEEWLDEALERIQWPSDDAPAVCLLDTGVNRGHSLLEPLLNEDDTQTVFADQDASDDVSRNHGTPMAGLAAYGDLRQLMLSTGTWEQLHRLESVKLIHSSHPHKPENYGAVTLQAMALPVISAPSRQRVYCLAITAPGPNHFGNPSSWSSAVDQAAAGVEPGDLGAKIVLISAGNLREHDATYTYPDSNLSGPIEDPAQAWNAITVGAISSVDIIQEVDPEARTSRAVAPQNGLSPTTRTSKEWRADWLIGPDIVMDGGNMGRSPHGEYLQFDSLQPLSTAAQFRLRPFQPMNATSAATALASKVAARVLEKYPNFSPQTIRGLLVHSARWPSQILERENLDPFQGGSTEAVENLIRRYGYGVVDEARALASKDNQSTIITERTIQPYKGKWNDPKLNQCHMISLPWAQDLLREHPETSVTLRVTLSYFIEPNPGSRTWEKSTKYHYASTLLRFRPKHKDQTVQDFCDRLDANQSPEKATFSDSGWALGGQRRGKGGSLIHDVWRGTAAQLADMGHIGIFPAKGWWAYRKFKPGHELHNCHLKTLNYSLIVSVESDADLPIHSTVEAGLISAADISIEP